ncbi:hypothetical protein HDU86_005394 [Geranomyces michiganensis]|nr:hypothetical protein HDU86_005394 [Geranomyces michiganensis]
MAAKPVNPRVFFDLTIAGRPAGRIVFELFASVVPKTAENFRALCTGERGRSVVSGANLHYKGSAFHRIIADFMLQGGDFTTGDGKGGESIYGGEPFKDESFDLKHDKEFLLSMANRGKDTNGSQFFITTVPTPHLDNKHVVFGRVVSGQALVREVEALPVDKKSRPHDPVVIANCGELERVVVPAATLKKHKQASKDENRRGSSDGESSDADRKRRKSKKEKRRRKRSPSTSNSDSDSAASSASDSSHRQRKSGKKRKSKRAHDSTPPPPVEEEYVGIAPPEDVEAGGNWLSRWLRVGDHCNLDGIVAHAELAAMMIITRDLEGFAIPLNVNPKKMGDDTVMTIRKTCVRQLGASAVETVIECDRVRHQ